jgi:hypothetical protein
MASFKAWYFYLNSVLHLQAGHICSRDRNKGRQAFSSCDSFDVQCFCGSSSGSPLVHADAMLVLQVKRMVLYAVEAAIAELLGEEVPTYGSKPEKGSAGVKRKAPPLRKKSSKAARKK